MPANFAHITEGTVPVLVHVPHAGIHYPSAESTPFRGNLDVQHEIATMADLHMDTILARIRSRLIETRLGGIAPYTLVNPNARIFMDPERFNDEREEMNTVGMGVVYTNGHDRRPLYATELPSGERESRIRDYYDPYSDALIHLTRTILDRFGRALFIDLHSYATRALPCELHADEARPPLCIGLDASIHDPDPSVIENLRDRFGASTNQPYHGTYVPAPWYRTDPRVRSIMLEVRKDQYMDEGSLAITPAADALVDGISEWIALAAAS